MDETRIKALVEKWRQTAAEQVDPQDLATYVFDEMLRSCADELEAALGAASPEPRSVIEGDPTARVQEIAKRTASAIWEDVDWLEEQEEACEEGVPLSLIGEATARISAKIQAAIAEHVEAELETTKLAWAGARARGDELRAKLAEEQIAREAVEATLAQVTAERDEERVAHNHFAVTMENRALVAEENVRALEAALQGLPRYNRTEVQRYPSRFYWVSAGERENLLPSPDTGEETP
jgi:hypothetical protein